MPQVWTAHGQTDSANKIMEIKHKILLKISWYTGLIALIGGWTIFLTWTGGRYFDARDFEDLELIGFLWMLGFFWLSIIALLLLSTYILINRKNLHSKMLVTGLVILSNIPSVLIILPLQSDIDDKVFVKLKNESGLDNLELKLHGNFKEWNLGILDQGSSMVFNYTSLSFYLKPDSLNLIVIHNAKIDTVGFPNPRFGGCLQLVLDQNLKLTSP